MSFARQSDAIRSPKTKRKAVPPEIQSAVSRFAAQLIDQYAARFACDRRLKRRVARLLETALPPQPGRPGFPWVTAAIRLRDKLRKAHPRKSMKWIWRQIYRRLIPGHRTLPMIERRMAEDRLRRQVGWRLYARRRGTAAKESSAANCEC